MKSIMILGAGRGQIGLFKAARRLGYHTIAVSPEGDYPGFAFADEKCLLDIRDQEAVAEAAERLGVSGIVTAGMDAGLYAAGAACDRCGLPGFSLKSAEMSANKWYMKDAFARCGVRTAGYCRVSGPEELPEVLQKLGMPLITKAVDLGGSRGIHVVKDEADLERCFEKTMEATRKDYCIIEEYIDGYECSATAFVAEGKVRFVLPTGDVRYGENDEIPIGHYIPFEGDASVCEQIREQVAKAVLAIGLDNCAVNADLMIRDGQVFVLELTGRLGANCIPELTSIYYGIDIYEWIVSAAMGETAAFDGFAEEDTLRQACLGEMILTERTGRLLGIDSQDPQTGGPEVEPDRQKSLAQFWVFKKAGDAVHAFRNPGDCIGQIVVRGKDIEECRSRMDAVKEGIRLQIEETEG